MVEAEDNTDTRPDNIIERHVVAIDIDYGQLQIFQSTNHPHIRSLEHYVTASMDRAT